MQFYIRDWRKHLGMTLDQLCNRLHTKGYHLTKSGLSKLEIGHRNPIKWESRLEEVMGLSSRALREPPSQAVQAASEGGNDDLETFDKFMTLEPKYQQRIRKMIHTLSEMQAKARRKRRPQNLG